MKLHELQSRARTLGLEVTAKEVTQISTKTRDKNSERTSTRIKRQPREEEHMNADISTNNSASPQTTGSVVEQTNASLHRLAAAVERQFEFNPAREGYDLTKGALKVATGILVASAITAGTKAIARKLGWLKSSSVGQ